VTNPIVDLILWVETTLKGKTGDEKLELVAEKGAGLFNLSFVPDVFETPIKKAVIKYIAGLLVETSNRS
jgi:hypothetical protein